MIVTKNIGMLLLGIYLILIGLAAFVPTLSGLGITLPLLALIAGICILLGK